MFDPNDFDPNEYRAAEAELRDRNRKAPTKIPAGIYTPPLRANGRSRWWEVTNRKETNFRNKAYGDLDRRFAEAAARRTEQDLLAFQVYGGEDEMIAALDEATEAEDNDVVLIEDDPRYVDYPEAEPLRRPIRTVVRLKKRFRKANKHEVEAKARELARYYGRGKAHAYLALAGQILQRPMWVMEASVVEDHDPLPRLDAEEQAEARTLSSEFIRESDWARRRRFQQHVAKRANRALRPTRPRGGRNGGRKPRHKASLSYFHSVAA